MTSTEPKSKIWGGEQTDYNQTFSLADVMSEQLVDHLQVEDDAKFAKFIADEDTLTTNTSSGNAAYDQENENSDFMIAQMMQLEFERERDESIRIYEKSQNAEKKLTVSYVNYRTTDHLQNGDEISEDSQDSDDRDKDTKPQGITPIRPKKKKRAAKGDTTKHDPSICGRKHVQNTQNFPIDFTSGDLYDTKFDFKLNNRVYNELKQFSHKDKKRYAKLKDREDIATQELAVDERTRVTLFKLIDNGTLQEVTGIVATGKEAVIVHALGGIHGQLSIPKEVAIKIFKTTLMEFKSREKYIKDDYRFKGRLRHTNPRKLIAAWVEKEMHNLKRLEKFSIPCPHVILNKKNAIIMDFIGSNRIAAPQLRLAVLNEEQLKSAYVQCLDSMRKMYQEAHLVHADLSEYNLLWHEDLLYFIDVSQSVEPSHPNAHYFLHRDCTNISNFFSQKKLAGALSPLEIFNFVTDMNIKEEALEATLITLDNSSVRKNESSDCQPHESSFDYLHDFIQSNLADNYSSSSESQSDDDDVD
eukprot:TRINITY_DN545_c0_g1_i1.p1 TRINITY_DN545_c0_g1~~TRINITY_DN545_c0_g1_i1.p1  ORF type:complete len:528 (-),score=108.61 TRINITY_DN545_c0_g1_i1:396-1979(-)